MNTGAGYNFSKSDTRIIKGVSILLMVAHHLFSYPDRQYIGIPGGIKILTGPFFGASATLVLGYFGQICVALFMFLAGYGLWFSTQKKEFSFAKKLLGVYVEYWKIFVIFVPIAFLFFAEQGVYLQSEIRCGLYDNFSIKDVLLNFVGYRSSLNYEWWFIKAYVIYTILGYLFIRLTEKRSIYAEIISILFLVVLLIGFVGRANIPGVTDNVIFRFLRNEREGSCVSVFVGIFAARHNLLGKAMDAMMRLTKLVRVIVSFVAILFIVNIRVFVVKDVIDAVLVLAFIVFLMVIIDALIPLQGILGFLGKCSTGIWLIHTFYAYYFGAVVKLVYISGNLWIDYVILFALSLISAIITEKFWSVITAFLHRFVRGKVHED